MIDDRTATVWSSTHVAKRSPIAGFGEDGYSVAWVDTGDGRFQVLVAGRQPDFGAKGRIVSKPLETVVVDVFVEDEA